jgi:hypothetical protein
MASRPYENAFRNKDERARRLGRPHAPWQSRFQGSLHLSASIDSRAQAKDAILTLKTSDKIGLWGLAATVISGVVAWAAWQFPVGSSQQGALHAEAPGTSTSVGGSGVRGALDTTASTPASPGGAEGVLFQGQVTLRAGTGVDLDAKQTDGVRADGPNGAIDVYHDYANTLFANGGDLYHDDGPLEGAAARCTDAVAAGTGGWAGAGSLNPGYRYCMRTSQGHVAWLRINSVAGTAASHVVVFNAVVWQ